jgi:hypothetical protein
LGTDAGLNLLIGCFHFKLHTSYLLQLGLGVKTQFAQLQLTLNLHPSQLKFLPLVVSILEEVQELWQAASQE